MKLLIAGIVLMLVGQTAAAANPAETRFTVLDGGAVIQDQQTGLEWLRCSVGQEWSDVGCVGRPARYSWDQAVDLTSQVADRDDWRLPTVDELQTLVAFRMFNPAIDPAIFPNTPPANFWSASEAASDAYYAWSVHFANGFSNWRHKRQRFEVRLVRTAD